MWRSNQPREGSAAKSQPHQNGSQRQQEVNDQIFHHVQEMFDGKVDGDVVYIILQEFDWNVDKAIDSLCNMCGSTIDADRRKSKLAEIARDVLCLEKKTKNTYSQQPAPNLMPSEFPALGSSQTSERNPSLLPTQTSSSNSKTNQSVDSRSTHSNSSNSRDLSSLNKDKVVSNESKNSGIKISTNKLQTLSHGEQSVTSKSPKKVGVIGERPRKKDKGQTLSPKHHSTALNFPVDPGGKTKQNMNLKICSVQDPQLRNDYWVSGKQECKSESEKSASFPSFHDDNDFSLKLSEIVDKDTKLRSSHNSLDDINDDVDEELDFASIKQTTRPGFSNFHGGIGQSILTGALKLSEPEEIKFDKNALLPGDKLDLHNLRNNEDMDEKVNISSGVMNYYSQLSLNRLWPPSNSPRSTPDIEEDRDGLAMPNSGQTKQIPSPGMSRYSFANTNLRHDSGEFDIDSLLREGNQHLSTGKLEDNNGKDQINALFESSESTFNVRQSNLKDDNNLTLKETIFQNVETQERPKSAEMQLPVVSFELSATAKEFIPRIPKEEENESSSTMTAENHPQFLMPKIGNKAIEQPLPMVPPRMSPSQYLPSFRPPRPPFAVPPHSWGSRRGPMQRPVPWMSPGFPFHDPLMRGVPPFLPPAGVLPVQRNNNKSTPSDQEKEVQKIKEKINGNRKIMIIMRGLPGSGKSTLARDLVSDGVILTTDEFFTENGDYKYDINKLSEAHEWNKKRAAVALEEGRSPVIIDNTNTQAWEIKPYLKLARNYGYEADLLEPNTPWKFSVKELAKRNSHGVPKESIQKMKERYQKDLTADSILGLASKKVKPVIEDKEKEVEFSQADFPELKNSFSTRGFKANSKQRKDSLEQELFLNKTDTSSTEDLSKNEIKSREYTPDSLFESSAASSDADSEKMVDKEFDRLSDNRLSPIPSNVGYVPRSHVGMSPINLHKQLEMISKRKTLMSPPVAHTSLVSTDRTEMNSIKEDSLMPKFAMSTYNVDGVEVTDTKSENETDKIVSDLIKEHVGDSWKNDNDLDKVINELKALVHFLPIEPGQRSFAENMIEEKVKYLSGMCEKSNYKNATINSEQVEDDSKSKCIKNDMADLDSKNFCDKEKVTEQLLNHVPEDENIHEYSSRSRNQVKQIDNKGGEEKLDNGLQTNHNVSISPQLQTSLINSNLELLNMKASEANYWTKKSTDDTNNHEFLEFPKSMSTWDNVEDDGNNPKPPRQKRQSRHPSKPNTDSLSDTDIRAHAPVFDLQSFHEKALSVEDVERELLSNSPSVSSLPQTESSPGEETSSHCKSETKIEQISNIEKETPTSSPEAETSKTLGSEIKNCNSHEEIKDTTNPPASPKKARKNSRRKMAARFPLFNEDDIAKFGVNDWTEIKVDQLGDKTSIKGSDQMNMKQVKKSVENSSTEISACDLKILHSVNNGEDFSETLSTPIIILQGKILFPTRESSVESNSSDSDIKKHSPVLYIDRSTVTEDFVEADISFLQNSFPSIPVNELKDILKNCDNNIEWAADLILDWNFYDLTLSAEDKQTYLDSIFKLQGIPKSPTIPVRSRNSSGNYIQPSRQPALLLDICVTYVEKQQIASKADIENQLIANSLRRLQSFESNIRYLHQTSRPTGDEIFLEDDDFNETILKELYDIAEKDDIKSDCAESDVTTVCDHSDHKPSVSFSLNASYLDAPPSAIIESVDDDRKSPVSISHSTISSTRMESPDGLVLNLELPREFTQALLSLFGSVGKLTPGNVDSLLVPVDYITAQRIYQCIKIEQAERHLNQKEQISSDEALARKLQTEFRESEKSTVAHTTSPTKWRDRPAEPTSLQLIMDEQMCEQRKRNELNQDLQASGQHTAISTRMKKQKLYDEFPGIDSSVLDDIFQANCYSYEDTIKAITGFLGVNAEPPKNVLTEKADDAYEKKLIQAAKQQSLKEMMDSYLYRPKVKEFQTEDNPKYEDIRGEAFLHYKLRHECFQKAQEAFRRGMKQVAGFYSNQAHLHTREIKEANNRAAELVLSQRKDKLERNSTLDLHGLHVDEAITILNQVIEERLKELSVVRNKKREHLFIITGRGSHSRGGVARIRPAVIRYFKNKKYSYTEVHEGLLKMHFHGR